jgi:hypothetical protein
VLVSAAILLILTGLAYPALVASAEEDELQVAWAHAREAGERHPGLSPPLIANSGLLALKLLRQIKGGWPEIGCLVLAACAAGRQMALAAGADRVPGVGLPAGQVYAVLQKMLEGSSRYVVLQPGVRPARLQARLPRPLGQSQGAAWRRAR